MNSPNHLDIISLFSVDRSTAPFFMLWPRPGNPNAILTFNRFVEWQTFIAECDLHPAIPQVVSIKFCRAQRLYLLAWIDPGLVKAGELVALTALELALKDQYGALLRQKNTSIGKKCNKNKGPYLPELLKHLMNKGGLTDALLPFARRYGGSIVSMLSRDESKKGGCCDGDKRSSHCPFPTDIASIRNSLAHGDPFDGLPWGGLLELVRDLIEYAYRSTCEDYSPAGHA